MAHMAGVKVRRRSTWVVRAALAVVVAAAGLPALSTTASAVNAPNGLTPSGGPDASPSPVLAWNRVADATSYDVQVASTSAFNPTLFAKTTTNRQVVPTSLLPEGTVYWRVRSNASTGLERLDHDDHQRRSDPSTDAARAAKRRAGPRAACQPPLLSWTAVQGATSYQVEVDPDGDFIGAAPYTTKIDLAARPRPQGERELLLAVRASWPTVSTRRFSDLWNFKIGALDQVQTVAPAETRPSRTSTCAWKPVKGAKTYELQVSTDQDFNTILDSKTNLKGTRYSPATTYLNDQYYWRVRARNAQARPSTG